MLSLVFACTLSLPATIQEVDAYRHCVNHQDVWVLGAKWSSLIEDHFEPEDYKTAIKVIGCESSGYSKAKNPNSTAKGLWQFVDRTWTWVESKLKIKGSPMDPATSTRFAAFLVYETEQGWGHWSESAHCWEVPNEKNTTTRIY